MGVKAGVPDIIIIDPPPAFRDCVGTVIELKRGKGGKLSEEQAAWLLKFAGRHWLTAVCFGVDQAIEKLEKAGY